MVPSNAVCNTSQSLCREIQVPLVVWVLQVRRVRQVLGESLVLMALTESQAPRVKRVPLAMMDTREKT